MAPSEVFDGELAWEPAPHAPVPAVELDDKVCTCAPEPYWIEWLEEQERMEREKVEQERRAAEEEAESADPRGCA